MSIKRFYRINIWLPVLLPLSAGFLAKGLIAVFGAMPSGISAVLQFLDSLIFFGVPYIPFALFATWWIRNRDEDSIRVLMFLLPGIMTAVAVFVCAIMAAISSRLMLWVEVAEFAATVILLVGYCYVALTLILRRLIAKPSLS